MIPSRLILTDFFQTANRALDYAPNLAVPLGARLVLLHSAVPVLVLPAEY